MTDLGLPANAPTNLLTNPGFESGLTGWSTQPGGGVGFSNPAPFQGSEYFSGGTSSVAFASQTINLIAAGYTAAQIDSSNFMLLFGGRIRSAAGGSNPSVNSVIITFLDGSSNSLGTSTATATNVSTYWELVGNRIAIPIGTRQIVYRFESDLQSGAANDGYLDNAFLALTSSTYSSDQGAWGFTVQDPAASVTTRIALRSPDLYVNWIDTASNTIRWQTYGNLGTGSGPLLVRIDLMQDTVNGPILLKNITPDTSDTGTYSWLPSSSGIAFGTYGLRIQVSLVGQPMVVDRSQETFTVPENGHSYYVNDTSTSGDQYTSAVGSNRNTGRLPSAPKPDINVLLNLYSLGGGDTLYVDNGIYPLFTPIVISAAAGIGDDQGFTLTGPTTTGTTATLQFADALTVAPLISLNDANLVTLSNLTLSGRSMAYMPATKARTSSSGISPPMPIRSMVSI